MSLGVLITLYAHLLLLLAVVLVVFILMHRFVLINQISAKVKDIMNKLRMLLFYLSNNSSFDDCKKNPFYVFQLVT